MDSTIFIGLDVGSTTAKIACLEPDGSIVFTQYKRHFSDIRTAVASMLTDAREQLPYGQAVIAVAGSAGMAVAQRLALPFVQEVIASSLAIQRYIPQTDVAIELGGEDAKITFFDGSIEQRMNETCAGGTGAFIDQMASYLETDAAGLNELAKQHTTIYPIASRCGVFAKTDVMPLLNEGASRDDIAASIFQAVVDQTVGGLACGRKITGHVAFLGGPLHFLSVLRERFILSLELSEEHVVFPENAQYFVALGAALEAMSLATQQDIMPVGLGDVVGRLKALSHGTLEETQKLPQLFTSTHDVERFHARNKAAETPRADITTASGDLFLGFDIGSTTFKAALVDRHGCIYYSHYSNSQGNPLQLAVSVLKDIYVRLPDTARIVYSGATGYGGGLIKSALHLDIEEVETIAHYQAARHLYPKVSFILDIGGQDMKCLHVHNGVIDRIMLNEACSAGCGVFIETFAKSLGMDSAAFAREALLAEHPVDLGSRCTVFMNSKVKQAQKEGATVGDIAAGLAYSVIRNALYKVIKITNAEELGEHVVAQGGSFLNDALLRAFELLLGREIHRPDIAGLMGAYGIALMAAQEYEAKNFTANAHTGKLSVASPTSSLISAHALEGFTCTHTTHRCARCGNKCLLTLTRFNDGRRHISGNRCEKGGLTSSKNKRAVPNLYTYKYRRLFDYYKPLPLEDAPCGVIGIPRVLNMFENYPFWFTFFTTLGFRVELSAPSSKEMYDLGLATIPSQTVCYPAKLAHGHVLDLLQKGIKDIFYPCVPFEEKEYPEADNQFNCPVVSGYPELLDLNIDEIQTHGARLHIPFLPIHNSQRLIKRLRTELKNIPGASDVSKAAIAYAVQEGKAEMGRFRRQVQRVGESVLHRIEQGGGQLVGVVLAGHPYHIDPGINHGIATMIEHMGVAVLSEDSIAHLAAPTHLDVVNQWTYHARLYRAAAVTVTHPYIKLVQLTSFGCGLDAITSEQVQAILEENGCIFTLLKIDEGTNLGGARIRIRSLLATTTAHHHEHDDEPPQGPSSGLGALSNKLRGIRPLHTLSNTSREYLCGISDKVTAILPDVAWHEFVTPMGISGRTAVDCLENDTVTYRKTNQMTSTRIERELVPLRPKRPLFTEEMRDTHTILVPQMSPIHFSMVEAVLKAEGYKARLLPVVDREAIEYGLKHVNNDVCYPAQMVIGQLIQAVKSGQYDLHKVALIVSQTGGSCRATNYMAFLRKALVNIDAPHIPIISLNTSGLETHPGFSLTGDFLKRIIRGTIYGDVLSRLFYATRPYEIYEGDAANMLAIQSAVCSEVIQNDDKKVFARTLQNMVKEFAALPIRQEKRPKVGVVGEIYLKYNPTANNSIMDIIEAEGGEAVPADMMHFFLYCLHGDQFSAQYLDGGLKASLKSRLYIWWVEQLRNIARKALQPFPQFGTIETLSSLADKAASIVSLGHQAGEGWLLTAEMLEHIHNGAPNIICLQPFACLPNHLTGKGVMKEIKRRYPYANIAAVDYDSGTSEVNQLNRIKLLMAVAHQNMA